MPEGVSEPGARVIPITSAGSRRQGPSGPGGVRSGDGVAAEQAAETPKKTARKRAASAGTARKKAAADPTAGSAPGDDAQSGAAQSGAAQSGAAQTASGNGVVRRTPVGTAPASKAPASKAPASKAPASKVAGSTARGGKAATPTSRKATAGKSPSGKSPSDKSAANNSPAGEATPDEAPAAAAGGRRTRQSATSESATTESATTESATSESATTESTEAQSDPHADKWERRVAGALAFVRRRMTGEYEIDDFGFDQDLTENVLAAPFRPLYEKYWRVEVRGLENVPTEGSALVVGNHSGTMAPLDAVMVQLALLDHHPARRHLRMLGADLVFATPFVGELARKSGSTLACNADAERLLRTGEVVGVWPEGFKGIGKPFSERYKLQRFGRGGFVSAALRTGAPIIPVSIVGAEEIYPMLGNAKTLARLLGLPYFPLTPTFPWLGPLGLVPLPSKWIIEFGAPVETKHLADQADDPMLVFNLTDQVRETIQQTLYRLLLRRNSVFS